MTTYKVQLLETEVVRYTWLVDADNPDTAADEANVGNGDLIDREVVYGEITDLESVEEWQGDEPSDYIKDVIEDHLAWQKAQAEQVWIDECIEEEAMQVDRAENAERVLSELEVASTNFTLGVLKYLSQLPKKEFDALTSTLAEARNLLNKSD